MKYLSIASLAAVLAFVGTAKAGNVKDIIAKQDQYYMISKEQKDYMSGEVVKINETSETVVVNETTPAAPSDTVPSGGSGGNASSTN